MGKKSINMMMAIFCLFMFFIHVGSQNAAAAIDTNSNAITTVLCNVTKFLTGDVARGVGVIAIVVVGVGLFMGKFSWGVGIATAIGIAMIFGAPTVVNWLSTDIVTGAIDNCKP